MSTVVTLPWVPTWEHYEWAKKHCPSYITNDVHRYINSDGIEVGDIDRTDYFFGNKKEALMFMLMWT